ncbi:MAG: glycosyltransferase [Chitinophagaceae bacterium]|nr:MAG: glycosyltransferase [Chitinophagaceae bacterium]
MTTTQNPYQVFAVVVTYNRLSLLKNTLEGLKAQSHLPAHTIVVNNGSSDGTTEWLDRQSGLQVIHQENVGGSGGFYTGVKAANEAGAEWIWIMDDDVLPEQNCLEKLLNYSSQSLCLNPIHVDQHNIVSDEERWFDATDCSIVNLHNRSFENGKKIWFRNLGSFEGMLIHRSLIEKIGFPDPRFFIAHDDLIYGYLASKHTNVAVIADAIIRRQPVVKSEESTYHYDYYYMYRNLWLLEEYAEKNLNGYSGYRKRRIKLQFFYTIYKIFFVDKPKHKKKALSYLFQAYRDYKKKKAGIKNG